eukprot:TRINITY_DN53068_c0_g1_i1.p1 TRINITY_DN53068_c0_g1~~TRINITY_DN53068_c0_g1_i1.p1  ORF type:complete len:100 (-),score=36.43 TRINITY_DN53068_c0_g1_i1:29-328(-)
MCIRDRDMPLEEVGKMLKSKKDGRKQRRAKQSPYGGGAQVADPSDKLAMSLDDLASDAKANAKAKRGAGAVSYTHLRAHETPEHLVCRLLLEKKKKKIT